MLTALNMVLGWCSGDVSREGYVDIMDQSVTAEGLEDVLSGGRAVHMLPGC